MKMFLTQKGEIKIYYPGDITQIVIPSGMDYTNIKCLKY